MAQTAKRQLVPSQKAQEHYRLLLEIMNTAGQISLDLCLALSNDLMKKGRLEEARESMEELREAEWVMPYEDGWRVLLPPRIEVAPKQ